MNGSVLLTSMILSAFHSCSPLLLVPLAILLYHLQFHFMKLNHFWQQGLKLIIVVSFPILKIKMALSLAEYIGSLPVPPKDTKNSIFPCSALSCLQMLLLHLTWSQIIERYPNSPFKTKRSANFVSSDKNKQDLHVGKRRSCRNKFHMGTLFQNWQHNSFQQIQEVIKYIKWEQMTSVIFLYSCIS